MSARLTASEREALVKRVRVTLAERDAKYLHPDYDREPLETSHLDWRDLRALCAEVERLTRERDEWVDRSLVLASESRVAVLTAEVERLERERDAWRRLVRDDGYAMTFQSLGQYRSALLTAIDAARTTGGRDA